MSHNAAKVFSKIISNRLKKLDTNYLKTINCNKTLKIF